MFHPQKATRLSDFTRGFNKNLKLLGITLNLSIEINHITNKWVQIHHSNIILDQFDCTLYDLGFFIIFQIFYMFSHDSCDKVLNKGYPLSSLVKWNTNSFYIFLTAYFLSGVLNKLTNCLVLYWVITTFDAFAVCVNRQCSSSFSNHSQSLSNKFGQASSFYPPTSPPMFLPSFKKIVLQSLCNNVSLATKSFISRSLPFTSTAHTSLASFQSCSSAVCKKPFFKLAAVLLSSQLYICLTESGLLEWRITSSLNRMHLFLQGWVILSLVHNLCSFFATLRTHHELVFAMMHLRYLKLWV